ncbi:hypothetical protein ACU635_51085 [[Actinomadura] parvosata]|uniref:hypothetical protein n=1 Tax=[Actinomadura] parvosata TaxID=1955412 RepID=UPI00406C1365
MGKHRARAGAITEPMRAVRRDAPPINPEPETATMPRITAADVAAYDQARKAITDTDEWMAPLRTGVERHLRQTMRQRGLLLAKRVGRQAARLRQALAKGGNR